MAHKLTQEHMGTLCICALRYCHGRETYMPSLVQDIIKPILPYLSDKDIDVMVNDCDFQRRFDLYGNVMIDKPGWLKWEEKVRFEQQKRYKRKSIRRNNTMPELETVVESETLSDDKRSEITEDNCSFSLCVNSFAIRFQTDADVWIAISEEIGLVLEDQSLLNLMNRVAQAVPDLLEC